MKRFLARLQSWGARIRPAWVWLLEVTLAVGFALWISLDAGLEIVVLRFRGLVMGPSTTVRADAWRGLVGDGRAIGLGVMLALAAVGMLWLVVRLWRGAPQDRGLRSLMILVGLIGIWTALVTSWPDLAWWGRRRQADRLVAAFEEVARPLRASWPQTDGDLPQTGPFMAYPIGQPTMFMLLTPGARRPTAPGLPVPRFSAVERSPLGALRFQLLEPAPANWLEWHPEGSSPETFVGGLANRYVLVRSEPLGGGWYLVRYLEESPDSAWGG
ncbi:MAG: hypothetical protein U0795_01615 [Pirellulales bacterium]